MSRAGLEPAMLCLKKVPLTVAATKVRSEK